MVVMNRKVILVIFVIFCSFCLLSSVSATDSNDVLDAADSDVEIQQSAEIDEVITETSSEDVALESTQTSSQEILSDGEDAPSTINQTIGTYIGGNGNDKGKGVYTDQDGNIYLAMETNSNDLVTTENAYQKNLTGGKDLFVSKYSALGDLIYATYIGGAATEMQKDLKVDSLGNVYVIGFTNSADFPVTDNAYQKAVNGSYDAFLTVLNPTGTALVYSTYLGGDVVDRAWALAIDDNGSAFIQGITNSINFPVTDDAYQKAKDGVNWSIGDPDDINYQNSFDLFLSKLNIYSGELQYSTFFGAKGSDSTYGSVAVDENEVIYFAGTTDSLDFPVTENAFRDVRAEQSDSFFAALDIKNNTLLFSSYIGGNSTDDGEAIVLSPNGFLYYVGDTWSENFPTTEGAYQTEFAGVGEGISGGDMFIMKIDTATWELVYATLLGGEFDEGVRALAVDEDECAWVVGMSQSTDYPVTDDAYQKTKNGPAFISYANSTDYDYPTHDTVISKISADGSELLYSTFFGGNSGEFAMGITFVDGGFAIQIRTCSDDLNVTDNTTKGQDQFTGSLLGNDPVYDFDSYLAVFENPTVIEIENITASLGENINLTATLTDSIGSTPITNKDVDFYVNDKFVGTATTDETGTATLEYTPASVETSDYTVEFNETIGHAAANASASIEIAFYEIPTVTTNNESSIILRYGTYLGGNGFDKGKCVYVDVDGNIYVAMESNSRDYVTTPGAFQSTMNGARDIVVAKFTKDGELVYLTYFGGSKNEMHKDFKVDSNGNAYVVGFTNSPDFPATDNAIMKNLSGIQNAFIAVFDPAGNLLYSTLIGGENVDRAFAVAVDDEFNAYIQGITNSPTFPVTDDAFQKEKKGPVWNSSMSSADITFQDSFDLFITKINVKNSTIEYSTFFGGETMDTTEGSLDVDENGIIYFGGYTSALLLNVTDNAIQKEFNGVDDAFLTVLDPINKKLVYSTYLGGSDEDIGGEIVVKDGILYYVGDTWSEDFPVSDNAYQKEFKGYGNYAIGGDAFILKMNITDWSVIYSTYFGASADDGIGDLEIDDDGNLYLLFTTESTDFPVTDDAYQLEKNGIPYGPSSFDNDYPTFDSAVVKLNPEGDQVIYSTFFGGSSGEQAFGFALNQGGFVLFIRTYSGDMPVTDDAYQPEHGNDSVASNYGRTLYYMDNYLGIFTNPTLIELEDADGKLGETTTLSAIVTEAMGNNPLANKSVDFYVEDAFIGTAITDENGIASVDYNPTKTGTQTYTVVFNETLTHAAANASADIIVAYYDSTSAEVNPNSAIELTFATYIGGNGNDKGKGVYIDKDGNIYLAMETNSDDLVTTEGAYQSAPAGGKDLYVSKYSPSGELIYATYIGGSATEMQKDLKVDSLGNVYVIGFTNSADYPTTANAFQKEVNGSQDAFLVVLNPNGTDLVYSTYLGGSVVDRAWALAIDDNGSAYIQGITNSINFPVTDDAFQKTKDGVNWDLGDPDDINYQNSFDLFLSKLDIYTGELKYSTFFGAKGSDSTYGSVAVDKNEVIYFAGTTTSLDFPVTSNAFRDVRAEASDSFLAALDIRNNTLVFSSYIGGNSTDDGEAIVLSPNGFLYYVGDTWSEDFPTTENAYQKTFAGVGESISGGDMFIMKIDTSDWSLVYSTLLGGEFDEGVRALAVDENECAWVVGMSQSEDYPVTADAYQANKSGLAYISYAQSTDYDYPTHDTVISKISPDGSELLYSTFFGGNSGEFAMGITFVDGGFALQIRTCSDDLKVFDNTSKGQDQFTGSLLGNDPVYDFDSYLAVFENPTKVTLDNVSGKVGDTINLTAHIKESIGNASMANKTVDFYVNLKYVGSAVSDENGTAILPYTIEKSGLQIFVAAFNETLGHSSGFGLAFAQIEEQVRIATVIESEYKFTRQANDYSAGERGEFFYAVLKDINGNPLANMTCYVSVNGPIYNVTTDDQGRFGVQVNLAAANTYTYALTFLGNDQYEASLNCSKLILTAKKTSITAKAKAFKAKAKTKTISVTLKTVKNPYDKKTYLKAGKKLTLKINGKTYTAKTNAKGVAKFTIKLTKKGKYNAVVKFAGDKTYKASSKKVKVTIK